MDQSKFSAEVAAFRALGLPVAKIAGARILATTQGMPADGKLRAGDLITSVDGHKVVTVDDVSTYMHPHKIGDQVRIGFIRGARSHVVTLTTVASAGTPKRAVIGVELSVAFRLPHDVEIDTQRIVGPSGGMIFALAIYDSFTAADLTKGHVIAGTGAIGFNDKGEAVVGDIGAIAEKVRAAKVSGADVFLAPADQAADARKVAPKSMKVIGVSTLAQALRALMALAPLRR
jgi:PDZ domain-containing protein